MGEFQANTSLHTYGKANEDASEKRKSSDGVLRKEKTGEVHQRVKFSFIQSKAAVKTPIIHFLGVLRRLPLTSGRPTTHALNKHMAELQAELKSFRFFLRILVT